MKFSKDYDMHLSGKVNMVANTLSEKNNSNIYFE